MTDQLAMVRLPRATYSLMVALLPALAAIKGAIVLGQIPRAKDLVGIACVIIGVAAHREASADPSLHTATDVE